VFNPTNKFTLLGPSTSAMADKRRTIRYELSGESAPQYELPGGEVDVHVAGTPSWATDTTDMPMPSPLTPEVATVVAGTKDQGFGYPADESTNGPSPAYQKTEVHELMGNSVTVGGRSWSPVFWQLNRTR
jgi:hypothetical protein